MPKRNNHDEATEALENTAAIERAEKELNATLEAADIDRVFTTPQSTDNVRHMMTPGSDDPKDLYMRADIPNKRMALAFALRDERCQEHGDEAGTRKTLKMIAALIGVQGKRIDVVSDTIIGERRHNGYRRSIGDWIRDKAGIGGDKE
jgi:hypothetical protein